MIRPLALIALSAAALAQPPEFENSYLRVRRLTLEPRASADAQWQPQRILIPLTSARVRVTLGATPQSRRVTHGDAIWYPAGDAAIENLTADPIEAIVVEVKGDAARPRIRTRNPGPTEMVLIENNRVRVLRVKPSPEPGDGHPHPDHLRIPIDAAAPPQWTRSGDHAPNAEAIESILVEVRPEPLTADLQGITLRYTDEGAGDRTLIFVHGWTGDRTFWRNQIPALADRYRVIALDLPGHGESEKPEQIRYTQALFADAIAAVMRAAAVKRGVIVGHSMGVLSGRQFIRKYPRMADAFIALDGPFIPPEMLGEFGTYTRQFQGPGGVKVRRTMVDNMFRPEIPAAVRKDLLARVMSTPAWVAASAMEYMGDAKVHAADRIDVPSLVIFAKNQNDSAVRETFLRSFIDKLDYQVWDGVSHLLMFDQPEKVNTAIRAFVDGLPTE